MPGICANCIQLDIKLQEANLQIKSMNVTINKLTAEVRRLRGEVPIDKNSKEQKGIVTELRKLTKCTLCHAWLKKDDIYKHMCIQKNFISCKYCARTLNSTQKLLDLLDHLVATDHEKKMNKDRENNRFFKCDECSLGYPMLVLLDCHKKSHMKVKQLQPTQSSKTTDATTSKDQIVIPGIVSTKCEQMIAFTFFQF